MELEGTINNGLVKGVKTLAFRLTDLCNLNCYMCGQAQSAGISVSSGSTKHYLSFEELSQVLKDFEKQGPKIHLWGGEPLLHPEFKQILEYLFKKKFNYLITTNGVFVEKYYKELVDFKVNQITVSLDGPELIHEEIRGKKGIFKKVIHGLTKLREYKKQQNKHFPIVNINTVILKENYNQLNEFANYLNDKDICRKINFQLPINFTDEMKSGFTEYVADIFNTPEGNSWTFFESDFKKIDRVVLKNELEKVKRTHRNVSVFPTNMDLNEWFDNPTYTYKSYCKDAWNRINIEPSGDMIACADFPETAYGNAFMEPLEQIFNNKIINRHREAMSQGIQKICSRCCHLYIE